MTAGLAPAGRESGLRALPRPGRHAAAERASSARAAQACTRSVESGEQRRRRVTRMGGARPSLDAAIASLIDGGRDRCLVCSGSVARRDEDGALVCTVCESALRATDSCGAQYLLDAA